jgi:hypothetical protein
MCRRRSEKLKRLYLLRLKQFEILHVVHIAAYLVFVVLYWVVYFTRGINPGSEEVIDFHPDFGDLCRILLYFEMPAARCQSAYRLTADTDHSL